MNSSDASGEESTCERGIDVFHHFTELAAKNADIAKKLCEDIDQTRTRLGLPIDTNMEHNFDVQEALAKGLALIDLNIASTKSIPRIIQPWIRAYRTSTAFSLIHGCALSIRQKEKDSVVAAQCMELLAQYMPLVKYISNIPSNKADI